MQRLIEDGPAAVAALAAAEHVTTQSVSRGVAILKVAGESDATDGRKKVLSVTSVGRGLFATVLSSRVAWLAHAIGTTVARAERDRVTDEIDLLERLAAAECLEH